MKIFVCNKKFSLPRIKIYYIYASTLIIILEPDLTCIYNHPEFWSEEISIFFIFKKFWFCFLINYLLSEYAKTFLKNLIISVSGITFPMKLIYWDHVYICCMISEYIYIIILHLPFSLCDQLYSSVYWQFLLKYLLS